MGTPWPLTVLFLICILNILGTVAYFILYSLRKNWHSTGFQFVLYIQISNFGYSLTWFVTLIVYFADSDQDVGDTKILCNVQSAVRNFAVLSCYFWNAAVCLMLHRQVLLHKEIGTQFRHRITWILIVIPILLSITPIFTNNYSKSQSTILENIICDLNPAQDLVAGIVEVTIIQIMPFWIVFIYNMYVVVRLYCFLRNVPVDASTSLMIKSFLIYPIIFMICWFYLCLIDMIALFKPQSTPSNQPLSQRVLAYSLCNMQGLLNGIIFIILLVRLEGWQARTPVQNAKTTIADGDSESPSIFSAYYIGAAGNGFGNNSQNSQNFMRASNDNSLWTNPSRVAERAPPAAAEMTQNSALGGTQHSPSSNPHRKMTHTQNDIPVHDNNNNNNNNNNSQQRHQDPQFGQFQDSDEQEVAHQQSQEQENESFCCDQTTGTSALLANKQPSSLNKPFLDQERVYSSHSIQSHLRKKDQL